MLRTGPNEGRMGWQSDREADPFTESCRTRWSDRSSGAAAGDLSRGDSRRGPVVRPVASAILYLHSDIAIAISIPPSRCGARYLKLRYAGPVRGLCVSVVRVHLHARLLACTHAAAYPTFWVRFRWSMSWTHLLRKASCPFRVARCTNYNPRSRSTTRHEPVTRPPRALARPLRRGLLIPHGSQARPSPFSRGGCAQHGFCSCRCCGAAAPEALMEAHGRITAQTTVLDL